MTVAVAKAIMLSRSEQRKKNGDGKGFQEFLVEVMQDFGRRYPHPTGAYGGNFAKWLRQPNPKPYGSYGNGSAMRVSPCGLIAVTMEEALALARASACVSHNHPEGLRVPKRSVQQFLWQRPTNQRKKSDDISANTITI